MSGEVKFFRKRFFGGFNRDDVVKYISKLAQERNEYKSAREAAEAQTKAMTEEVEPLRIEAQKAREIVEKVAQESGFLLEAKEKAENETEKLRHEINSLKLELAEVKSRVEEGHSAKEKAQQEIHSLNAEMKSLRDAHEQVKLEAEKGREFRAEALESRAKVEQLEIAQKHFKDLQPHLESLRSVFVPSQGE